MFCYRMVDAKNVWPGDLIVGITTHDFVSLLAVTYAGEVVGGMVPIDGDAFVVFSDGDVAYNGILNTAYGADEMVKVIRIDALVNPPMVPDVDADGIPWDADSELYNVGSVLDIN